MNKLEVELLAEKTSFRPGETIGVRGSWELEVRPEALEARLFWYTEGKGDRDVDILETQKLDSPSAWGSQELTFTAPQEPLSFSGKLISLIWAIELVALPDGEAGRRQIVISHTGEEIRISPIDTGVDIDIDIEELEL